MPPFSFLTNHGLVLLCIADDPRVRMRDIARTIDITERAAQRIVADLVGTGYVSRTRHGRRNTYTVRTDLPVVLPADRDVDLNSLLRVLLPGISSSDRRDIIEDRQGAHDRRTKTASRREKVRSDTRQ
jgi:MarR family